MGIRTKTVTGQATAAQRGRTSYGESGALFPGRTRSWAARYALIDTAALGIALAAANLESEGNGALSLPTVWTVAFGCVTLCLYGLRGAYSRRQRLDILNDLRLLLTQTALGSVITLAAWTIVSPSEVQPTAAIRIWLFASLFVTLGRLAFRADEIQARRRAADLQPTLIVGAGTVGATIVRRLLTHPEFGLRPVGYLDEDPLFPDGANSVPVLGATWDLERVVAAHGIEKVIISFARTPHEVLVDVVDRCRALRLDVAIVPRLFEQTNHRATVEHLGGIPLINFRWAVPGGAYLHLKYALDRFESAALLILVSPLLAAAAILVRISMGRPILFRQTRIGLDGRRFYMLKFRTMDSGDDEDAASGLPPDTAPGGVEGETDRRTRVGRFLRQASIDELPQLFNVLKGEMSLIGPRPERPDFVDRFNADVQGYGRRHRVKSGITGWAQVHGLRGKTSISERAELDNYYIENFSFWLDVKILLLTIRAVFSPAADD